MTKGDATYSPSIVLRYSAGKGGNWDLIEEFEDATVRDNGSDAWLRVPQAMLRAYSNDPDFFGDEDYQAGNGIHVQNDAQAKRHAEYFETGNVMHFVMDCDNDIALKRIMGTVISKFSFGHGVEDWIVLTQYNEDDDEWNGWGGLNEPLRYEKWSVRLRESK